MATGITANNERDRTEMKYSYKIEGTDGATYGTGECDKANGEVATELVWSHNPTDDDVIGWNGDRKAREEMCYCVEVSNSDDFYVTFKAIG